MSIRFYTTDVEAEKTAREMQGILAKTDARYVSVRYDDEQRPTAIQFELDVDGQPLSFRIEPDVDGMTAALNEDDDTPGSFDHDQGRRTAWRIYKEWLNSVLAFRATRQAPLDKLLLGYGVTPDGRTVYQQLRENHNLLTD